MADSSIKKVFSICSGCTVRCPIEVEVENGAVRHIWGNPHLLGGRYLCPKGAAQKATYTDTERVQHPMIRDGERGSGKWRKVGWEEALDYVADKLNVIIEQYGGQSIVLGDRGGPFTDLHKAFIKALGSPNYFNHHASCSSSVHNAHNGVAGQRRNTVSYDWKNCKYCILYARNIVESLATKEVKDFIDARENGMKVVYTDVRWSYTASKADRFFIMRPGADYAFNLALIHTIVKEKLYNEEFVNDWVLGMAELVDFIEPYTPAWAEAETGVPAKDIVTVARELAQAAPYVILNQGWMTARGEDDYYFRRSIYILNALLGAYEAKGGLLFNKNETHCGYKPLRKFADLPPKVDAKRFDGIGWKYRHLSADYGLAQMLPYAIQNEDPYPVKAFICYRFDPLSGFPDPEAYKAGLLKLDLLVSVDINYSHTAWISDVILPESLFLERTDPVIVKGGPKPALWLRRQAVEPRYDSKPRWWIIKQLAKRLGVGQYFPYETAEEMIAWQLRDMGLSLSDFDEKGYVALSKDPIVFDRKKSLPFKTPSQKFEMVTSMLENNGIPSFPPYESPPAPPEGQYRLITGKVAVHTQGTSLNNIYLHELLPENRLWINDQEAKRLGLKAGDAVEVSHGDTVERGELAITEFIHPEVVYTLHGFGRQVPLQTRAYKKGMRDTALMKGLLKVAVGGNCPIGDCFVTVRKASKDEKAKD
jgi:thiosulfate reductase/polysulfide reductase chain A